MKYNRHDFVEIAGIKWATCNVGAEKPTDAGLYFQWGDRKGYTADEIGKVKRLNLQHYKHYNGKRITKYTEFDGKLVLDLCDDAAFAYMGHGWRMPTYEEFDRLIGSTTQRWANNYQNSGVAGMVFTDRTDKAKKLFFPAVGTCCGVDVYYIGLLGNYWSGSLYSEDVFRSRNLSFDSDAVYWQYSNRRHYGFAVRGILTI